jgi:hypothetical protein
MPINISSKVARDLHSGVGPVDALLVRRVRRKQYRRLRYKSAVLVVLEEEEEDVDEDDNDDEEEEKAEEEEEADVNARPGGSSMRSRASPLKSRSTAGCPRHRRRRSTKS